MRNGDKEMRVSGKEPYKVKSIINKANTDRHMRLEIHKNSHGLGNL